MRWDPKKRQGTGERGRNTLSIALCIKSSPWLIFIYIYISIYIYVWEVTTGVKFINLKPKSCSPLMAATNLKPPICPAAHRVALQSEARMRMWRRAWWATISWWDNSAGSVFVSGGKGDAGTRYVVCFLFCFGTQGRFRARWISLKWCQKFHGFGPRDEDQCMGQKTESLANPT
jgi:hypothetical protein